MTNGDKIRSMTDEELERWIRGLMAAEWYIENGGTTE